MECTIQSLAASSSTANDGTASGQDPATIPSGKVGQVCREWLVREDGVLAYQLQNEEINKHYEGNRNKNQVVRSDLHQAKSLQEYEYHEMMRRYQEELEKQLENDARIAAQIQEQEIKARDSTKSGLQRQESVVERDRLIAERLQAKEKMKVLKYKLLKEKRQVERVASGSGMSNGEGNSPSNGDNHSNHSSDSNGAAARGRRGGSGDIVDISDLTEFCMKPPDDLTEEEKRIFLEEQDAELARFLQKQEAARNMAKDSTKQNIESHDAEIARILQDQEKAKARKLREKARLRALQRQQLQDQQQQSASGSNSVHHSQHHHQKQVQSNNPVQVHSYHQSSSSTHGPSFCVTAAHSPSITNTSSSSTHHTAHAAAHSQPMPSSAVNHSFQNSGSTSSFVFNLHSVHDDQHQFSSQYNSNLTLQSSNPLKSSRSNGSGSNSPHFNNNHGVGTNCCQGVGFTSSSHCHTSPNQCFETFSGAVQEEGDEEEEEECYDDDNPIVDRYYPVGDDFKRMNLNQRNQGYNNPSNNLRSSSSATKMTGDVTPSKELSNPSNNFHNIAMDLDPTYNRSADSKSPSNGNSNGHNGPHNSGTDVNGLHFAHLCRVSPTQAIENGHTVRTGNKSPEINPAILPVPGHRRQEKSKKNKKMADGCKQQ